MAIIENKAIVFGLDNNGYFTKEFKEQIGSDLVRYTTAFHNKNVFRGVTLDEQNNMPLLWQEIGAEPKSQDWVTKSADYFMDWEIKIPIGVINKGEIEGGMLVDGGYEVIDKTGEIRPNNINDYLLMKLMEIDPNVAKSIEDWEGKSNYSYFLIKKEDVDKKQDSDLAIKLKVSEKISELSKEENLDRIKQMLKVYSKLFTAFEIELFNKKEAFNAIFKMAETETDEFFKACKDKKLLERARIADYVNSGALIKMEDSFYLNEVKIANSEAELIVYLGREENSTKVFEIEKKVNNFKQNEVVNAIV